MLMEAAMKKELFRNGSVAVVDELLFWRVTGLPEDVGAAAAFVRQQLAVGEYKEVQFASDALAAACKEALDDIVTVRSSVRVYTLDAARFSPAYHLAEAYTLEQEERRAALLRGVSIVSDCRWDETGELFVYTAPAYREMRLGTVACKVAVARMLEQGLSPYATVRRHQYPAAALAARIGFVLDREEPVWGLCKEAE